MNSYQDAQDSLFDYHSRQLLLPGQRGTLRRRLSRFGTRMPRENGSQGPTLGGSGRIPTTSEKKLSGACNLIPWLHLRCNPASDVPGGCGVASEKIGRAHV